MSALILFQYSSTVVRKIQVESKNAVLLSLNLSRIFNSSKVKNQLIAINWPVYHFLLIPLKPTLGQAQFVPANRLYQAHSSSDLHH